MYEYQSKRRCGVQKQEHKNRVSFQGAGKVAFTFGYFWSVKVPFKVYCCHMLRKLSDGDANFLKLYKLAVCHQTCSAKNANTYLSFLLGVLSLLGV